MNSNKQYGEERRKREIKLGLVRKKESNSKEGGWSNRGVKGGNSGGGASIR